MRAPRFARLVALWHLWLTGALVLLVLVVLVVWGSFTQGWTWTGIGPFSHPRITTVTGHRTVTEEYDRGKTLWDLLQLLIIPLALAAVGIWFSARQKSTELQIAESVQEDAQLDTYLTRMSDLLLEKNLRKSERYSEPRTLARAWTLAVLPRLNSSRKRQVVQFLYEARLIRNEDGLIELRDADLSGAELSGCSLVHTNLFAVLLANADLSHALLGGANLGGSDLTGANLHGAFLNDANLHGVSIADEQLKTAQTLRGATMPDGTRYTTWEEWEQRRTRKTEAEIQQAAPME